MMKPQRRLTGRTHESSALTIVGEQRHVLFEVGGRAFAVPADTVQRIHDELALQRVDGTRSWFLGLAVADGRLLPITDLGAWFGLRAASGRILQVHPDVGIAGLRVDVVHGLSDAEVVSDAADNAEVLVEPLTVQSIHQDGREHRVIDVAGLLRSEAFLDIAAESA